MKIHLYLYDYELTLTGEWTLQYLPNIGDSINIYPFLTKEDLEDLEDVLVGDITSDLDCSLSPFQKRNEDCNLLPVLYNHTCTIENKIWKIFDGEWSCSFHLKL